MKKQIKKGANSQGERTYKAHNQAELITGERSHAMEPKTSGQSNCREIFPFSAISILIAVFAETMDFPLASLLIAACEIPANLASSVWLPAIFIASFNAFIS